MFFYSFLLFSLPPRGAPPNLWQQYEKSIDLNKNLFRCFDGSSTINLSQFNNNIPDCKDGSDEPGSSYESGTKFYCQNDGWISESLDKWKVDDGVCDCCDCSDESQAISSQFGNQCSYLSARKKKLIAHFQKIFTQGFEIYKNYSVEGDKKYRHDIYDYARLQHRISILEQQHQRIIDQKSFDDLEDPDDFVLFEEFTPPPKTLSDESENGEDEYYNEDDYDDRYDRDYEYYDRYRYYHQGQSYQNDFTYEYIPPNDSPSFNDHNFEHNFDHENYNFDEPSHMENQNTEEESAPEPLSPWRQFVKKIWRYTFLFPDRENLFESDDNDSPYGNSENYYQDYQNEYPYYNQNTRKKLNEVEEKLSTARGELYKYEKLRSYPSDIDKAYYYLFGQEFAKNDFTFTVFHDFKQNWDYYGNFKSLNDTTKTMYYYDSSYCQGAGGHSAKKQTKVQLICWNENKLARIIKDDECSFKVYFATPAACNGAIDRLSNMAYEELDLISEIMKVDI